MNILFMCVANSARSQLAEGMAKNILRSQGEVQSAGSEPKTVNPYAIRTLQEIGVDISQHRSKSVKDLAPEFLAKLDYVITLCEEEVCPVLPSATAKKLHWPFPDPAGHPGTDEEQMARFREMRRMIGAQIEGFLEELRLNGEI